MPEQQRQIDLRAQRTMQHSAPQSRTIGKLEPCADENGSVTALISEGRPECEGFDSEWVQTRLLAVYRTDSLS